MRLFYLIAISTLLGWQTALAWNLNVGIGERYQQSVIEDTSNSTTSTYAGYGFEGELRLRLGNSMASMSQGLKATPEIFIMGGSLSQQNSSSATGYSRKGTYVGGGMDFCFENIFLGGQVLSNSITLETTTSTTTNSYSAFGARFGYATSIGLPANGTKISIGVISGMGKTTGSPVYIVTENAAFINLQFRLYKSGAN